MFGDLGDKIREALAEELPGKRAHGAMMPTARNDNLKKPDGVIPPVKSAVLVLLYSDDRGQIKFPLIQRPRYNGAHSGQVSLPGGKAEPTDKSLIHTALREAQEEIGVVPANIEVVGEMTQLFIWVSNYIVKPVVALYKEKPVFLKEEKEVDEIIETDLFDIINPQNRKQGTVYTSGQYRIKSPYIEINNKVVWGATAMILNELSMIVEKAKIY